MFTACGPEGIPGIMEWLHTLLDDLDLCVGGPRASECPEAYQIAVEIMSVIFRMRRYIWMNKIGNNQERDIVTRGKAKRVQYYLDSGEVKSLSAEEIVAILRAADELIGQGGRTLLVKNIKRIQGQKVLELGLEQCPVYGYYKGDS